MLQPSARRYAVQLLEARDLDDWENRVDQLIQAQATAVVSGNRCPAERQRAGRFTPARGTSPGQLLNAADPIPFRPRNRWPHDRTHSPPSSIVRPSPEGGQRGKAMADLVAARRPSPRASPRNGMRR